MIPCDTRLQQRDYEAPKVDMRHGRHSQQEPTQVLSSTITCISSATLHRTAKLTPTLRTQHRDVTNAKIHQRNRETRETAVAMRHVERSAALEIISLSRHRKDVLTALEKVSRMLWLGSKTSQMRALRPGKPVDEVSDRVSDESKTANSLKKSLEEHLTHVDKLFHDLKAARECLQSTVKAVEKEIQLAPHSYSTTSPLVMPQNPEILSTQQAMRESSRLRLIGAAMSKEIAASVASSLEKTEKSLSRSASQSDAIFASVVQTQSKTYLALNTARRSAHMADIQRDVDAGPQEGRFEQTRQKFDRPLVRLRPGEVQQATAQETSPAGFLSFTRSYSAASVDVATLASQHRRLSAAAHDAHLDMTIDQQVARHRRRCDPARRV